MFLMQDFETQNGEGCEFCSFYNVIFLCFKCDFPVGRECYLCLSRPRYLRTRNPFCSKPSTTFVFVFKTIFLIFPREYSKEAMWFFVLVVKLTISIEFGSGTYWGGFAEPTFVRQRGRGLCTFKQLNGFWKSIKLSEKSRTATPRGQGCLENCCDYHKNPKTL